jgi:hypothetical protein
MDQPTQQSIGDQPSPSPPHVGTHALSVDLDLEAIEEKLSRATGTGVGISCDANVTARSPTRSSRYANMGLNRTRSRSTRHNPDRRSRNTTKAAEQKKAEPVRIKNHHETVDEEEDLAELESLMMQQETQPPPWQPIDKTSWKCTGYPTESGWQSINDPAHANTSNDATFPDEPLVVHQADTPEQEGSVIVSSSDPVEIDEAEQQLEVADPLDEKYFKHSGYLNYINNVMDGDGSDSPTEGKRDVAKTKVKASKKKDLKVVLEKSPAKSKRAGKALASQLQTTKAPAQQMSDGAARSSSPASSSEEAVEWELLEGNIDAPRTGNKSVHKLTIKLYNNTTGESKTFTYTDVPHEDIDWKSKPQVVAITQWRTDIFHTHGINTKKNTYSYMPLEDAWMELLHGKLRATVEAGHAIKLPGPVPISEAFNAFFEGKVLRDAKGADITSRPARDVVSIRGKLDGKVSKVAIERRYMRGILRGRTGGVGWVPGITEEELTKFLEDGSVVVEDPNVADKKPALDSETKRSKRSPSKRKRDETDVGKETPKKMKPTS